ncbi:hypothetical protein ACLBWT_18490 [Paenibacillus sp. D51F]
MNVEAIYFFIILFVFTIIVVVPFSAMLVSFHAILYGRYLNRYFIVSRKGDGQYELHHHPAFGFYFAREKKFYRFTVDAIQKFRTGYPDVTLNATTLTLQSCSRKGSVLKIDGLRLLGARLLGDMLILLNLANYRKSSGQWCFVKLIGAVHRNKPMRYVLIDGHGHEQHTISPL